VVLKGRIAGDDTNDDTNNDPCKPDFFP